MYNEDLRQDFEKFNPLGVKYRGQEAIRTKNKELH